MDKRLQYKLWHHKNPRGEHKPENLRYSTQHYFTGMSPRTRDIKGRINKWDFIKIQSSTQLKKTLAKWVGNQPYEKIYLQMIPRTRVSSPKYIKNSYESIPGRQTIKLENRQKTWTDISPKRTFRGPMIIWKDAQHNRQRIVN